MHLTDRFVFH
jgi:hypothetical protein